MGEIVLAPAKLTISLKITGIREDGYHLINSEMTSLSFCDVLHIRELSYVKSHVESSLEVRGVESENVPTSNENLIISALRLVNKSAFITLNKQIPVGGGLGGGSSDAAAVLRWCGVSPRSIESLKKIALIGADVPFCLLGGRARVFGIGDEVYPLKPKKRTYTLLLPPFGVNTAAVYREYDNLLNKGSLEQNAINDLEKAATVVEPRLIEWRDKLSKWTGGVKPTLAGSGSTWFVEGIHERPSTKELGDAKWMPTITI